MTQHNHYTAILRITPVGDNAGPTTYTAHCKSCGWEGRPHESHREALADADEHAIAIARLDDNEQDEQ